ncbi:uncharacterized protein EAE97_002561 [Botrytis byssoidea]|uniref:Uncharacterized protein n=1 Tax=Botrytis byssoidea TaxID=139641 RepID=A0A9P5IVQ1_9HELO|nr:uncharacterized protein EAE97_002561 [Botrytis byssoidea]KAF7951009.1 hypothetical protein EAE97_002561 [Botrytis byssoidea]
MHILPREFDLGTVMRPTERKFGRFTERERFKPRETLVGGGGPFKDLVESLSHHRFPPSPLLYDGEEEEEEEKEKEEEGENDFAPSLVMVPEILEAETETETEAEEEEEKEKPATLVVSTE